MAISLFYFTQASQIPDGNHNGSYKESMRSIPRLNNNIITTNNTEYHLPAQPQDIPP